MRRSLNRRLVHACLAGVTSFAAPSVATAGAPAAPLPQATSRQPATASSTGRQLLSPLGMRWGASPQEIQHYMIRGGYKFLGPTELSGNPDHFLHEQRYEGNMLGLASDHIAPLFFGGRFFSVAVSYSPTPDRPASMLWKTLVDALTAQYGKPTTISKPYQMISLVSVLKLLPDGEQKGQLLAMYAAADANRDLGRYTLQDLEIRVGMWVPEAVWTFGNNSTVKAVMRAATPDEFGLTGLKPAVVYANYDLMK